MKKVEVWMDPDRFGADIHYPRTASREEVIEAFRALPEPTLSKYKEAIVEEIEEKLWLIDNMKLTRNLLLYLGCAADKTCPACGNPAFSTYECSMDDCTESFCAFCGYRGHGDRVYCSEAHRKVHYHQLVDDESLQPPKQSSASSGCSCGSGFTPHSCSGRLCSVMICSQCGYGLGGRYCSESCYE